MKFNVINSSIIDRMDSAFPTLVKLDNGDLICGFCRGGGPEVTGGSHWSRSRNNGASWQYEGVILPPVKKNGRRIVNSLRLSRKTNGEVIAYGQRNYISDSTKFGTLKNDAVFCISDPSVTTWSKAFPVPSNYNCPVEISNPMIMLSNGRWLSPSGLLTDKDHLGEKVIVRESCDEGRVWGKEYTVFADKMGKKGFFEPKIIETIPGRLIAFAWTVELGTYKDLDNHFAISNDSGRTWSEPRPTPISGQTLTPLWLGDNQFLLVYNYRKSPQGIKLAFAEISAQECRILKDEYLWRPKTNKNSAKSGINSFDDFAFGLPSATRLDDETFLVVFWCKENGIFGIRQIKFRILI